MFRPEKFIPLQAFKWCCGKAEAMELAPSAKPDHRANCPARISAGPTQVFRRPGCTLTQTPEKHTTPRIVRVSPNHLSGKRFEYHNITNLQSPTSDNSLTSLRINPIDLAFPDKYFLRNTSMKTVAGHYHGLSYSH